jgi:hypothetical protein
MRPEAPKAVRTLDFTPVTEFDDTALGRAGGNGNAAVFEKSTDLWPEGGWISGAAHHGNIESLADLGHDVFELSDDQAAVRETELSDCGGQKRSSLLPRLQKRHVHTRHYGGQRDSGNPRA